MDKPKPQAKPGAAASHHLWAPLAWVQGQWEKDVLLGVDAAGRWCSVQANTPQPSAAPGAPPLHVLPGPVLPALVNAHSHAFQRAFVGLSERRESAHDDFWSWRERMYGVALRITPQQLYDVAAHLYTELLAGGYSHTCEFHYLHHREDGQPYADEATLSRALAQAAVDTGMGLTLLPVLYERAGFAQPSLLAQQRRFGTRVDQVLRLRDTVRAWRLPNIHAGVAIHSLRAATAGAVRALAQQVQQDAAPIHIHIAEQTAEVQACLGSTGARPIEWLAREVPLNPRWQLVHATHATPAEIKAVAASGAGVVLCPSTEANLGDGLCDLPRWLDSNTPLALGSDSHVTRSWPEELRWLEYGQRLALRQRNVAASPATNTGQTATAARLFERCLAGGAAAAAMASSGLQVGARADLVLINTASPALAGAPNSHLLDATVFAAAALPFAGTWVAGQAVTAAECPSGPAVKPAAPTTAAFNTAAGMQRAMAQLWPQPETNGR